VQVSAFDSSGFARALPASAGAIVAVLAGTFLAAKLVRRHNVIDVAWGLLFVAVAVATCVLGTADGARRALLLALPLAWGLRLAIHIGRRSRGKGEDPRYLALLAKAKGNQDLYALRMVYVLQGGLAFVISAPIQVGMFEGGGIGPVAYVGLAVWLVGVLFEAVGDAQMERFRSDPANKGKVIDVGLWRYTRHPNYFGDACVWWGIYLVAAERWPGVLTIPAPLIMTLLLTKGSGARIMEQHMARRPGWAEYAARTSGFFPLPPRNATPAE
jgi:steroid 5-alpha reductase family enzyme